MSQQKKGGCLLGCGLTVAALVGFGLFVTVIKGLSSDGKVGGQAPPAVVSLDAGIKLASDVAGDPGRCSSEADLWSAWQQIRGAAKAHPRYKEARSAAAALEKCRAALARAIAARLRTEAPARREEMARQLERTYLDSGIDARVRAQGGAKDRLTITWVLAGRVFAHKSTDGGSMRTGSLLHGLQEAGFRKVTFTDGRNESHAYTLEPQAPAPFERAELNSPIALPE